MRHARKTFAVLALATMALMVSVSCSGCAAGDGGIARGSEYGIKVLSKERMSEIESEKKTVLGRAQKMKPDADHDFLAVTVQFYRKAGSAFEKARAGDEPNGVTLVDSTGTVFTPVDHIEYHVQSAPKGSVEESATMYFVVPKKGAALHLRYRDAPEINVK